MIFHEIALEPLAVEDLKDLGLIERMFGFEHGRLIPFLPAKPKDGGCWRSLLFDHLKSILPPGKHKDLELRIIRLTERATYRSRNRTEIGDLQTWSDLALHEHATLPFAAILCADAAPNPPLLPFQGLHAPDDTFPAFLREPVHVGESMKDPGVFLDGLRPLILSAKRMAFIDPYFDPTHPDELDRDRWRRTVSKLAEFLRISGRLTFDLSFHTAFDGEREPESFVKGIAAEISGWFPPTTSLSVTAWAPKHKGIRFHARYLITDKGGVGLDYGTDLGPNRRTDVSLLPTTLAQQRLKEFDPKNPSTFEMEATIQTSGTRPQ